MMPFTGAGTITGDRDPAGAGTTGTGTITGDRDPASAGTTGGAGHDPAETSRASPCTPEPPQAT
jgi:hypothetical protein